MIMYQRTVLVITSRTEVIQVKSEIPINAKDAIDFAASQVSPQQRGEEREFKVWELVQES